MNRLVIFIQGGGGEEDYAADGKLVASLQQALGKAFEVRYPLLLDDESLPDFGRIKQITKELSSVTKDAILVAHSLGASMLLRHLSENNTKKKIAGLFLISTPHWSGDEEWKTGLKLRVDFADKLRKDVPLFFYHCLDDGEVPFSHLSFYKKKLPWATFREISHGGHQLNNDLTLIANDIKSL